MADWFTEQGVTHIAMEATGSYWKPVWYVLEEQPFQELLLVTSEGQRIAKTLEDAGIKLGSVASEVLGVSGRAMVAALVAGERDPETPSATPSASSPGTCPPTTATTTTWAVTTSPAATPTANGTG